ncbi:MAG: LysE family translocator [Cohaesibacteraceae bacterium]|nr:LysE family translocator [Cohaesibacteraceae bacterium]
MLDQILVIIGITTLVMFSPGPDLVIVIRNTLTGGRAGGFKTSAGILLGNMVHITYCAVGIGLLISQSIVAFNILKYAGVLYLLYLGFISLRNSNKTMSLEVNADDAGTLKQTRTWFLQGFVSNVLNPKGTLFYLGVFTMVITPETSTFATVILSAISVGVSGLFWLIFVTTLDRRFVRNALEKGQVTVNRLFGGLLIFLGVRIAFLER